MAGLTAQLEGDRDGSVRRDFITAFLFGPADGPVRKAHIIESMSNVDTETAFQAFAAMSRWDGRAVIPGRRVLGARPSPPFDAALSMHRLPG
ncbi:MAG: hypothetical protein ACYCTI_11270 [Acidimicrobiales bacterium]